MAYETTSGIGVSNHYGVRQIGGAKGVTRTEGIKNEAAINFDGEAFPMPLTLPAGIVVTQIVEEFSTGAVTAATIGAVDISAAAGTEASYVEVPLGGEVTITGPTAGTVYIYYLRQA